MLLGVVPEGVSGVSGRRSLLIRIEARKRSTSARGTELNVFGYIVAGRFTAMGCVFGCIAPAPRCCSELSNSPSGKMPRVSVTPLASSKFAPSNSASSKFAPRIFASSKHAPSKFAPTKETFIAPLPVKSAPRRFRPEKSFSLSHKPEKSAGRQWSAASQKIAVRCEEGREKIKSSAAWRRFGGIGSPPKRAFTCPLRTA